MSPLASMTGFGEGRAEDDRIRVSLEIRTVNHRFLDLALKLPDSYRALEIELSNRVKERLERGRVEVRIRVEALSEPRFSVRVRRDLARRYLEAIDELADAGAGDGAPLSAADLLRLPEVVKVEAADQEAGEGDRKLLMEALDRALEGVVESRQREGRQLEDALRNRLRRLQGIRGELAEAAPAIKADLLANLQRRLGELLEDQPLDDARLAQEAAVLADRADVEEELDRLAAHLRAFSDLLEGEGSRGKRLDFLTQEILRELNTLGAKSRNSEQLERVVEAKEVCEQLREQVQNVE